MNKTKDISELADIRLMVDSFYGQVRTDDLLGDIFNGVIQDKWPEHLDKMYRFWQTVLLSEHTYSGSPFRPHAPLQIDATHFSRWLELFHKTVDTHFEGPKADEAKWRAGKMAEMFNYKIQFIRSNPNRTIV